MKNWQQSWQTLQRQQIIYELEQCYILAQGVKQGYSISESLQCMSAFAGANTWLSLKAVIENGGEWSEILMLLRFRLKTIRFFASGNEWHDIEIAVTKAIRLLQWELEVRTQLAKTFAYPALLLGVLIGFALIFQFGLIPQLDFFLTSETIWLFHLPKLLGIITSMSLIGIGSGYWWWSHASFRQRQWFWKLGALWKLFTLWSCLRLAHHCQLTFGQQRSMAQAFRIEATTTDFFSQRLHAIHQALGNGEQLHTVMKHQGFHDETWLSFFIWQPTNAQIIIASEFYWEHAFRQLQQQIERSCQIGQVVVFLVIGVVLLQFYLTLFFPIFEMMNQF